MSMSRDSYGGVFISAMIGSVVAAGFKFLVPEGYALDTMLGVYTLVLFGISMYCMVKFFSEK